MFHSNNSCIFIYSEVDWLNGKTTNTNIVIHNKKVHNGMKILVCLIDKLNIWPMEKSIVHFTCILDKLNSSVFKVSTDDC